jgi:hypothetical protein
MDFPGRAVDRKGFADSAKTQDSFQRNVPSAVRRRQLPPCSVQDLNDPICRRVELPRKFQPRSLNDLYVTDS